MPAAQNLLPPPRWKPRAQMHIRLRNIILHNAAIGLAAAAAAYIGFRDYGDYLIPLGFFGALLMLRIFPLTAIIALPLIFFLAATENPHTNLCIAIFVALMTWRLLCRHTWRYLKGHPAFSLYDTGIEIRSLGFWPWKDVSFLYAFPPSNSLHICLSPQDRILPSDLSFTGADSWRNDASAPPDAAAREGETPPRAQYAYLDFKLPRSFTTLTAADFEKRAQRYMPASTFFDDIEENDEAENNSGETDTDTYTAPAPAAKTRRQKIQIGAAFAFFFALLAFIIAYLDTAPHYFYPAQTWHTAYPVLAPLSAALITIAVFIPLVRTVARRKKAEASAFPTDEPLAKTNRSDARQIIKIPAPVSLFIQGLIIPVFILLLVAPILTATGFFYTRSFGAETSRLVLAEKLPPHLHHKTNCLTSPELIIPWTSHLCLPANQAASDVYDNLPDRFLLGLQGKQSWFGFYALSYRVEDSRPPLSLPAAPP